jgi:hypothetical protein
MVGMHNTDSEWLLFLDGDMELDSHFLGIVTKLPQTIDGFQVAGVIGIRNDVYVTETGQAACGERANVYGVKRQRRAPHFGGALLIKREAIAAAGGYRSGLMASEEPDLYARMLALGWAIVEVPAPFVQHYTRSPRHPVVRFLAMLSPTGRSGAFGRSVWFAVQEGYFGALMKVFPGTGWIWLLDAVTVLCIVLQLVWIALALQVGTFLVAVITGRWKLLALARLRFCGVIFALLRLARMRLTRVGTHDSVH